MGKRVAPRPAVRHDWFLNEWAAMFGKRQADACAELGWSKTKASFIWNGRQHYTRELVDEVSRWLNIRPWELLMTPDEAMQLRRLREAVAVLTNPGAPLTDPTQIKIRQAS